MFSKRLKLSRKRAKLSQKEIAKMLFISQQAYAKYETGSSTPNPDMLTKISAILGAPVEFLLGIEDEYRLTKQEWIAIGQKAKALRESCGLTIKEAYDKARSKFDYSEFEGGLTPKMIESLEENGERISPCYIIALSQIARVDDITYFSPYSAKLFYLPDDLIEDENRQTFAEAQELSDSEKKLIELVKSLDEEEIKEVSKYIDYIISKRQ